MYVNLVFAAEETCDPSPIRAQEVRSNSKRKVNCPGFCCHLIVACSSSIMVGLELKIFRIGKVTLSYP